jgi:hypothetical protein
VLGLFLGALPFCGAQTLSLPARSFDAPTGSALVRRIEPMPLIEREAQIEAEIRRGNVPEFLRRLSPVTVQGVIDGTTNRATFFVTPDYLSVGSDTDYFLTPLTPQAAERIADATGCLLPTRRMVDAIHSSAEIKLTPTPIPPSAAMTSVNVFAQHNALVRTQRLAQAAALPLGSLVAGHKKDVVLANRLTNAPGKVAIFGWHRPDGSPIQPLYTGHADTWVDYSHGIRLVQATAEVNGKPRPLAEVLRDPKLATLLSDEGPLAMTRYPSNRAAAVNAPAQARLPSVPTELMWSTNSQFAERAATFRLLPDVRVQINEPLALSSAPANTSVVLILYTLPNGSTIEQTTGRKLRPGDDWHFDIQHVAAQTRFVRAADTNRLWAVAYLEAGQKSWPAWRKAHAAEPAPIPAIVEALAGTQAGRSVRIVLSGHSGGGSFIFGYLNAVERIPDGIERIAFLDANYAYDPALRHPEKLARWLKSSEQHFLSVLAYNDAVALLDGKPFVSATGGTWYRSHLMKTNLAAHFEFTSRDRAGLETASALSNRVQLLLRDNPDRTILHTLQVERNGFIQSMLSGTALEGRGYEYFGPRAYGPWIQAE